MTGAPHRQAAPREKDKAAKDGYGAEAEDLNRARRDDPIVSG
jgi:hypothetical protein